MQAVPVGKAAVRMQGPGYFRLKGNNSSSTVSSQPEEPLWNPWPFLRGLEFMWGLSHSPETWWPGGLETLSHSWGWMKDERVILFFCLMDWRPGVPACCQEILCSASYPVTLKTILRKAKMNELCCCWNPLNVKKVSNLKGHQVIYDFIDPLSAIKELEQQ